jgi:predicted ATPase
MAAACEIATLVEDALTLLDDALQIVERTGGRWLEAELHRRKGQLMLRQGHSEAAEGLYRKALSIAKEQEAKLWELRAAASLAGLRRDQSRQPRPATSSRRSTAGSPKGSTYPISKRRRRCSTSWRKLVITGASASFETAG